MSITPGNEQRHAHMESISVNNVFTNDILALAGVHVTETKCSGRQANDSPLPQRSRNNAVSGEEIKNNMVCHVIIDVLM